MPFVLSAAGPLYWLSAMRSVFKFTAVQLCGMVCSSVRIVDLWSESRLESVKLVRVQRIGGASLQTILYKTR